MQNQMHAMLANWSEKNLSLSPDQAKAKTTAELLQLNLARAKGDGRRPEYNELMLEVTEDQYLQLWRNIATNPHAPCRSSPNPHATPLTPFRPNSPSHPAP